MGELLSQLLLVALPVTPAFGAVVVGLCPPAAVKTMRAFGWGFSILTLLWWVLLQALLHGGEGLLVAVNLPWVPDLGISLHLGLDGTGVMMAGMISFISMAAVVGTLPSLPELSRSHIVCLLLAECGMLGAVASWDLILFIACWEVTLVPFFLLMGRGLTRGGVAAATRFFVTSVASSVLMWVGVLLLVRAAGSPRSFDLAELAERFACGQTQPTALVWFFAPAFLMRMAAFPLHTWFPAAQADAPTAASVMLAGGVLPLGGFGVVHLLLRLFGPDLGGAGPVFVWIGLLTALGGGLVSVVQRDLKRLLAYACLSQMGLALAGLALPSRLGRDGGLMMLLASGLGGASLFLFAGVVCRARTSQRIVDLSGLWRPHPGFSGFAMAGIASLAALPGTVGFVGAWLILKGLASDFLLAAFAACALFVTGASVLWAVRRVSGGGFQEEMWTQERWPRKRQVAILALLALVLLGAGIVPGLFAPSVSDPVPSCTRTRELDLARTEVRGGKP